MLREAKASSNRTAKKYVEYASGLLRRLLSSIVELHISQDQLLDFISACIKKYRTRSTKRAGSGQERFAGKF
jgi:hypothetical protein